MKIEKVDPNREPFSDYRLVGTVLTVAGIAVDLEAEQENQEKVIAITKCSVTKQAVRGMKPCCEYMADIIIPPRKYETVTVDPPPKGKGKGKDGERQEPQAEEKPLPLDLGEVILRTWPVGARGEINEETGAESEGAEGEKDAE
jgi:hypothetical protein